MTPTLAVGGTAIDPNALNDSVIAELLLRLYEETKHIPDGVYEHEPVTSFDWLSVTSGVCWAIKRINNIDVILLRGSVTFQDWIRDLLAIVSPIPHAGLGPVHPGFMLGMDDVWEAILNNTTGPWIVAGHSLGAGRAQILSGLMALSHHPPMSCVCFGSPRPGFGQLAAALKQTKLRSYRNADKVHHRFDMVTALPFSFPPEEYVHPGELIDVMAVPNGSLIETYGAFSFHHMPLYVQALKGRV